MRLRTDEGTWLDLDLSPDGKEISYTSDRGGGNNLTGVGLEEKLQSVGLNGEQPRDVFSLKYVDHVSISPDGRSVAFTGLFNGCVAPLPMTGGSIELSKDTQAVPVTLLGTDMGSYLHWRADSKSLHWMVGNRYHSRTLAGTKADAGGKQRPAPEYFWQRSGNGVQMGIEYGPTAPCHCPKSNAAHAH